MMNRILLLMLCLMSLHTFAQQETFEGRGALFGPQKIMDLSNQNLKKLPISALNKEVETLILDNNQITELPRWIGDLKNLKILSIRNNNLLEVQFSLADCKQLEQVYLSGNKNLVDASTLSSCPKMSLVDVTDTQIHEVPGWVRMMDHLLYFKYTVR